MSSASAALKIDEYVIESDRATSSTVFNVQIKENLLNATILQTLLLDRTTKSNIIWATSDYKEFGAGYDFFDTIEVKKITGENNKIIKPRVAKTETEKKKRCKQSAEIFTPSWICNNMNNCIDKSWFDREIIFNKENCKTWETITDRIKFPADKTWQDYIMENRLEITCGEAPYIVSRYDAVTGEPIPLKERIGLLDRKLRIVNENLTNKKDWTKWAIESFKHCYGYDYQGDNVLLARENLFYSFIDYYVDRWQEQPDADTLNKVAHIISWNVWQMDGLKQVVPRSCEGAPEEQMSFFDEESKSECKGCKKMGDYFNHIGIYCKIMDWDANEEIRFVDLVKKDGEQ